MIIQCPQCSSKYRTTVAVESHFPLKVVCPQCQNSFVVENDTDAAARISEKILIVDDARFFRELLIDLLAERDDDILTADTAENALSLLSQQTFSLLIVDVNLPDMNGLKLIELIRQKEQHKAMKILCLSGVFRRDEDALRALRSGADDFLSKSFQPQEFLQKIDSLLSYDAS